MKALVLVLVLVMSSCSPPTREQIRTQTRAKLIAGDEEGLYEMGWRSLDAAIDLMGDAEVGAQATQFVERCAGSWESIYVGDQEPAVYWREWYAARKPSIESYGGFNCRPGPHPGNILTAESTRPIPSNAE